MTEDRNPNLSPVKKVRSDGVEQTYWVNREDLGKKLKAGDLAGALAETGLTVEGVEKNSTLSAWYGSSMSHAALKFRAAAARLRGKTPEEKAALLASDRKGLPPEYLRDDEGKFGPLGEASEKLRDQAYTESDPDANESAHVLSGLAALSQSSGYPEMVTLYRGVRGKQAADLAAAVGRGRPEIAVGTGILSSFSESQAVAKKFASGGAGKGVVFKVTVPREDIAISHRVIDNEKQSLLAARAFSGVARNAKEVVLFTNGEFKVKPSDITVVGRR